MQRRSHIVPSHVPFWTSDAEAPIVKTWRAKVCPDKKSTEKQNFSSKVVFLPCRTASKCRSIEAGRQEWSWGVRARFRQWRPQSMIPHSHPHNVEEWTICDWRNLALRHCVKPFLAPFWAKHTIIQGSSEVGQNWTSWYIMHHAWHRSQQRAWKRLLPSSILELFELTCGHKGHDADNKQRTCSRHVDLGCLKHVELRLRCNRFLQK